MQTMSRENVIEIEIEIAKINQEKVKRVTELLYGQLCGKG